MARYDFQKLRSDHNITQKELADKLKLSQGLKNGAILSLTIGCKIYRRYFRIPTSRNMRLMKILCPTEVLEATTSSRK